MQHPWSGRRSSPQLMRGGALLRAAVGLYGRLDVRAERALAALRGGVAGLLGHALTQPEKTELTVYLYDLAVRPFPAELSDWEQAWYLTALPPPPARVLLGAAGSGREAAWLVDAGYQVDAFEPSALLCTELERRLGARARVTRASYEDVLAAHGGGPVIPGAGWLAERYDAVILGWGSLTHVLDPASHLPLLALCDTLSPRGPVLASFWLRTANEEARGRAHMLGAAAGRRVAGMRGVQASAPAGEQFRTHCGFAYQFERAEIEAHAAAIGRRVLWDESGYPHVTFVRAAARE